MWHKILLSSLILLFSTGTFARSFCEGEYQVKIKLLDPTKVRKLISRTIKVLTGTEGVICEITDQSGFFSDNCRANCDLNQMHLNIPEETLRDLVYSLESSNDYLEILDRFDFRVKGGSLYIHKARRPLWKIFGKTNYDPEKYPSEVSVEMNNPENVKESLHIELKSKRKFKRYY